MGTPNSEYKFSILSILHSKLGKYPDGTHLYVLQEWLISSSLLPPSFSHFWTDRQTEANSTFQFGPKCTTCHSSSPSQYNCFPDYSIKFTLQAACAAWTSEAEALSNLTTMFSFFSMFQYKLQSTINCGLSIHLYTSIEKGVAGGKMIGCFWKAAKYAISEPFSTYFLFLNVFPYCLALEGLD